MQWYYLALVDLIAVTVSLGLAVYARRQRDTPGALAFAWVMVLTAGWSLSTGLRLLFGATPEIVIVFQNVVFAPIAFVPVAYLAFALHYTGRGKWLSHLRLAVLCIVPLVTQVMVWTSSAHGLFVTYGDFYWAGVLLIPASRTQGMWFWVHALYSYSLMLISMGLIVIAGLRSFHLYRRQAVALLLGAFLPVIITIYTTFSPSPVSTYFSPLGFVIMGVIYSWAIFRYRLLDLAPVARATLVEIMSDGMLVLDGEGRVVDLNPAMWQIAGLSSAQVVGRAAAQVLAAWPDLVACLDEASMQTEITRESDEGLRYYDLRISSLSKRGRPSGRLVLLRDITARRRAEQREMDLARDIQMSLLPLAAPNIPGIDVAGWSLPAREVGGDLYAYHELPASQANPRGGYGLAVGDVTGKGIPAALYMTATMMVLSARAPFVPDAAHLLSDLNAALYPHISSNRMNVALCYVQLERAENGDYVARIANAGMIAPILRRGAQCEYLDIGGLPLGALDTVTYPPIDLQLQKGDMLIVCSDGVAEAMNPAQELYGLERLTARIAAGPVVASAMIEWIVADVQAFAGRAEQHDDITIVALRVQE